MIKIKNICKKGGIIGQMSKKLLTLKDLENYYSSKKKSFHFSAKEDAEAVVVQVSGSINFSEDEYDPTLGLLPVHLQSCHIDTNRNHSNISKEVMEECMTSIYNRPIMGFIHQLSDGSYDFAGHEMHIDDEGEIEYEEIACGTIPESCNPQLVYDEEKEKTYLEVDGYIYEEYTRAADILKNKKESKVSVELALLDFAYNAKTKVLDINKFIFSGVTILGVTRDEQEKKIEEGMLGSNIKLKDFSESNNSMFSSITEEEQCQLVEMREKIDTLLSRFNINEETQENYGKEEIENVENEEIKVNEEVIEEETEVTETEVTETESTEEVTETATENESEKTVEDETPEVVESEAEEVVTENEAEAETEVETEVETEEVETEVETENEEVTETEACGGKKKKYTKTFELSFDDIKYSLYQLLAPYEESDNDWYWITSVYEDHFVYQGCAGNYFGQKYSKDGDQISFEGERYELFVEFVTASEKAELETMRTNYAAVVAKLNSYEKAELNAQKEEVVNDAAYAEFSETEGFKSIKENIDTYSVEDLRTACDLAFAKEVKAKGAFSMTNEKQVEKKPSFFAFAKQEQNNSFLDGLLKK